MDIDASHHTEQLRSLSSKATNTQLTESQRRDMISHVTVLIKSQTVLAEVTKSPQLAKQMIDMCICIWSTREEGQKSKAEEVCGVSRIFSCG